MLYCTRQIVFLSLFCFLTPALQAEDVQQAKDAQENVVEQPAQTTETADASKDDKLDEGHSYHGEVFNEGPRQAAYLIPGTGNVHIEVTTPIEDEEEKALAQKFFDQGLGQLYGFWYFEAERSFRQAAAYSPDCAMAYWGMAQANESNEKRARGFIKEAVDRKDKVSPREKRYIEALAAYLKEDDKKDKEFDKKRRQSLVKAYENILHEFPNELEVKALIGLALYQNRAKGIPISSYFATDAIMNDVLDENPLHPCHHFRIHLWDYEKPERALNSAALCGESAPAIAHMWHMSGHIYSRLKRYHEAAWQQEASARVDHAHMMRDRVLPDQIHNFAHNNEWLIRNLIHIGRANDAIDLAKNMIDLPRHPKYNTLSKTGSAKYGRMRLFQALEEFQMWHAVLALQDTHYLEPTDNVDEQLKRLKLIANAKFATGDALGGDDMLTSIINDLHQQKTERDEKGAAAKAKAVEDKKDEKEIKKAEEEAQKPFDSRIRSLEAVVNELKGQLHLTHLEPNDALVLLEKVSGFDRGRLAQIQLFAGENEKAIKSIEKHLDLHKEEVIPLAQAVDVYWRANKQDLAKSTFEKLRKLSENIDLETPAFAALSPIAKELGYETDWRVTREIAKDFGDRPQLDSLGPFRWSPTVADEWSLQDHLAKTHSLKDYAGKPVVVIFYLGFGCLHCAEQLQKFAPKTDQFKQAGIELIAISTDDQKGLVQSHENYKDGVFPFPLVSNSELDIFKKYRCYDDFEQQPLHGVFLIDPQGQTRWLDISYEPFMDADFLLEESQRLLKEPSNVPPTKPTQNSVSKASS